MISSNQPKSLAEEVGEEDAVVGGEELEDQLEGEVVVEEFSEVASKREDRVVVPLEVVS